MDQFGTEMRRWRRTRRLSQMALAGEAAMSPRHLSFIETGRARPSREMVLRLARALELPPEAANALLNAAGFAPAYRRRSLEEAEMAPIQAAMTRMIDRHDPWPALLLDRDWQVQGVNRSAARLFGPVRVTVGASLLEVFLSHGPAIVVNWGEVGDHLRRRLRAEARARGGAHRLERVAAQLDSDPEIAAIRAEPGASPLIPTVIDAGAGRLSLYSTFTRFGGAEDAGLADLMIEMMFPADEATDEMLRGLAKG